MRIAIIFPTYNRGIYLQRAVDSVVGQLQGLPPEVDVALSIHDNASTDNTKEICTRLADLHGILRVYRRPENIGADANILAAISSADADYIWIFGDDDYLRAGSLSTVIKILLTEGVDVLKIGATEERDLRLKPGTAPARDISSPIFSSDVDRYNSSAEILRNFGVGLGNFTSLIFSSIFFHSNYRAVEQDFFDSGYSQLEWIYRGLAVRPDCFGHIKSAFLVLRIEISPRGLSPERVKHGLSILSMKLLEIGYPKVEVRALYESQCDAILLSRVKAYKIHRMPIWSSIKTAWKESFDVRSRLKIAIIFFMPSTIYRRLWSRL